MIELIKELRIKLEEEFPQLENPFLDLRINKGLNEVIIVVGQGNSGKSSMFKLEDLEKVNWESIKEHLDIDEFVKKLNK